MTLILTHTQISDLLDRAEVYRAVENAFAGLALGEYCNPAPRALPLPDHGAALPMMAGGAGVTSVKLLSDLPGNRDRSLPTQRSTIMVTSGVTGECLALLDGRAITAMRTAAASAVATAHLAPTSSSVLGLVGAGSLAIEHAQAIAAVRGITEIVVWSRSAATAEKFAKATENLHTAVIFAASPRDVFDHADIVCTLTPSRDPVAFGEWFRAGQHINAVGAPPRPDHREIDGDGMRRARVIVDSLPTVMAKSGAVLLALEEGLITEADIGTELGHVVAGTAVGRRSDAEVTLFESVGLGLQDLVTARLVVDRAYERGIGTTVHFAS
ncbi:ornithine cyclodeaminase family protein [Mycolicibacterium sp. BiH015]|uniref:ornithine cyclodeaminase family protein n=1 Tax=Mycolicibacterium sp. BiH015 TaxID=3018808 RepID=UPI0022E2F362|nr:ornithine cyclodeaminase family protein [Mycolicibacterium sp. BiH015]MDA2889359.1 ornithine cyclodeaminase family protein [Mycolicibacterium sp. BiH015]